MTTRTCSVRSYERRIPERKCSIDNAIHRQLRDEVNCERAAEETCAELLRLVADPTFFATGGYIL